MERGCSGIRKLKDKWEFKYQATVTGFGTGTPGNR